MSDIHSIEVPIRSEYQERFRDDCAKAAMASWPMQHIHNDEQRAMVARYAYKIADAMLKAREAK